MEWSDIYRSDRSDLQLKRWRDLSASASFGLNEMFLENPVCVKRYSNALNNDHHLRDP